MTSVAGLVCEPVPVDADMGRAVGEGGIGSISLPGYLMCTCKWYILYICTALYTELLCARLGEQGTPPKRGCRDKPGRAWSDRPLQKAELLPSLQKSPLWGIPSCVPFWIFPWWLLCLASAPRLTQGRSAVPNAEFLTPRTRLTCDFPLLPLLILFVILTL